MAVAQNLAVAGHIEVVEVAIAAAVAAVVGCSILVVGSS